MAKEKFFCLFLGEKRDLERAETPNLFLALTFQQDSQASVTREFHEFHEDNSNSG